MEQTVTIFLVRGLLVCEAFFTENGKAYLRTVPRGRAPPPKDPEAAAGVREVASPLLGDLLAHGVLAGAGPVRDGPGRGPLLWELA